MSTLRLHLSAALRAALEAEARQGAPNEVCGVLGGIWRGAIGYATCHIAVPNIAPTPQTHFVMDHGVMVAAIEALERARRDLIGVYHSHPCSAPIPSPADLAACAWIATPYLIIGYAATQPTLAAWLLNGATFTHLLLI
ncbi:MAG: hypothetical protein CUN51_08510 [Candidatus Thermofonsia Clade 1 bacterium]|uniref:MPN domain-containing protein n=1 Tax=Candidatus Thermofonsia Clade 1 bacterium TaxID=2364210 RepID=A0A2M8NY82_9CHLR|nr:MAG: hypothetical protein CUN51_08510 [Candidatus Thermofonsia Clade 1 bacterium]